MLVKLGKQNRSDDPVDLLLECHTRIRHFLALGTSMGSIALPSVVEAAAQVERYFREALPLHVQDEEESVVPRLQGESAELDAALERMSLEHRSHGPLIEEWVSWCRELRERPEENQRYRFQWIRLGQALESELAAHLDAEEALIFPALRRLLAQQGPENQLKWTLLQEIRSRRAAS